MSLGSRQKVIFNKFETMTNWMCDDIYRSIFNARANFLVAMGLFNYIEVVGSFITGPFKLDANNKIKINRRGKKIETKSKDRFEAFFAYMGNEYIELMRQKPKVYDELRCGLTHEYLIKRRMFCVYGCDVEYTEGEMDQLVDPACNNQIAKCGVIYENISRNLSKWHIVNAKLFIDFKRAVEKLKTEIVNNFDSSQRKKFFDRSKNINMINF